MKQFVIFGCKVDMNSSIMHSIILCTIERVNHNFENLYVKLLEICRVGILPNAQEHE